MKTDFDNFGRCGQIGEYAVRWVGNSWVNSTIPCPSWFVRNGLFILLENLKKFNIFITELYYNIMCKCFFKIKYYFYFNFSIEGGIRSLKIVKGRDSKTIKKFFFIFSGMYLEARLKLFLKCMCDNMICCFTGKFEIYRCCILNEIFSVSGYNTYYREKLIDFIEFALYRSISTLCLFHKFLAHQMTMSDGKKEFFM